MFDATLFHGSESEKIVGTIRIGERDSGWFGRGFYLSAYEDYAKRWGPHVHVMRVRGRFAEVTAIDGYKKVIYHGDAETANQAGGGDNGWIENEWRWSRIFSETLARMGYDGVRVHFVDEGVEYRDVEVVVFDPNGPALVHETSDSPWFPHAGGGFEGNPSRGRRVGPYVYHGTPRRLLTAIRRKGLEPMPPGEHPDEKRGVDEPAVFFSPFEDVAGTWGRVVLRFPWPAEYEADPYHDTVLAHDENGDPVTIETALWTRMAIPPDAIEIKAPGGAWRPLVKTAREVRRNDTYYHGTHEEHLPAIRKKGLSYPFLASEPGQAWCWGRSYSNDPRGGDVRVLEVEIDDVGRVVPDFNLMDPRDRQRALGVDPDEYFDVRSGLVGNEEELLEAARRHGSRSVQDRECGGDASIYLGMVPPERIHEVDRSGGYVSNPPGRFVVRSRKQGLDLIRHPAIVKNFAKALRWRPRNDLAVLVPCAGTKPFPEAPSHRDGYLPALEGKDADLWVVSEPLGVVPYEWSRDFPNANYDFPPKFLRGEAWDALVERVAEWLEKVAPKYRKVFVALPGHHERLLRAALEVHNPGNLRDATHTQCLESGACPPGHGRSTSTKYRRYLGSVVRNPDEDRLNHDDEQRLLRARPDFQRSLWAMWNARGNGIVPPEYMRRVPYYGTDRVRIYRGVRKGQPEVIRPGDWVALTPNYALEHGAGGEEGGNVVVERTVDATDVTWAGTDMNEWFYSPHAPEVREEPSL